MRALFQRRRTSGLKRACTPTGKPANLQCRVAAQYTVILNSIIVNALPTRAIKPLHAIEQLWQASELAAGQGQVIPTGDAQLNAELPGGGWPVGALVEVLQAHSGHNDWRLLLPALVQTPGMLVLVAPPHRPFAPGLAGQGLDPDRLLCISPPPPFVPAARLWAAEQALRCKDVSAVLAWLPQARADALRRLQIAAAEHRKLLFVMRPAQAQHESSPAVLRLITSNPTAAAAANADPLAADALVINILKRRGPPLERMLTLLARPARLAALLALKPSKTSRPALAGDGRGATEPQPAVPQLQAQLLDFPSSPLVQRPPGALDRAAA